MTDKETNKRSEELKRVMERINNPSDSFKRMMYQYTQALKPYENDIFILRYMSLFTLEELRYYTTRLRVGTLSREKFQELVKKRIEHAENYQKELRSRNTYIDLPDASSSEKKETEDEVFDKILDLCVEYYKYDYDALQLFRQIMLLMGHKKQAKALEDSLEKLLMNNTSHAANLTNKDQQSGVSGLADEENSEEKTCEFDESITECFHNTSDFVRDKVKYVIKKYYYNSAANLTLIEITLYDHGLLKKRNRHKDFLDALVGWNILRMSPEEIKKTKNAMSDKYNRMPKEGYLMWGKDKKDWSNICKQIGQDLGETIKYWRNT